MHLGLSDVKNVHEHPYMIITSTYRFLLHLAKPDERSSTSISPDAGSGHGGVVVSFAYATESYALTELTRSVLSRLSSQDQGYHLASCSSTFTASNMNGEHQAPESHTEDIDNFADGNINGYPDNGNQDAGGSSASLRFIVVGAGIAELIAAIALHMQG